MTCQDCGVGLLTEEVVERRCRQHLQHASVVLKLGPMPFLYRVNRLAWLMRLGDIASERWPQLWYAPLTTVHQKVRERFMRFQFDQAQR